MCMFINMVDDNSSVCGALVNYNYLNRKSSLVEGNGPSETV